MGDGGTAIFAHAKGPIALSLVERTAAMHTEVVLADWRSTHASSLPSPHDAAARQHFKDTAADYQ